MALASTSPRQSLHGRNPSFLVATGLIAQCELHGLVEKALQAAKRQFLVTQGTAEALLRFFDNIYDHGFANVALRCILQSNN